MARGLPSIVRGSTRGQIITRPAPRRRRHRNGRILNGSSLDFGNTSSRPVPNLSPSPALRLPQIPRSPHQIESAHHVTHLPWSFPSESELFSKVGATKSIASPKLASFLSSALNSDPLPFFTCSKFPAKEPQGDEACSGHGGRRERKP